MWMAFTKDVSSGWQTGEIEKKNLYKFQLWRYQKLKSKTYIRKALRALKRELRAIHIFLQTLNMSIDKNMIEDQRKTKFPQKLFEYIRLKGMTNLNIRIWKFRTTFQKETEQKKIWQQIPLISRQVEESLKKNLKQIRFHYHEWGKSWRYNKYLIISILVLKKEAWAVCFF